MLRRLALSVVLIGLAALLSTGAFIYTDTVSDDMLDKTDNIISLYENGESCFYETKELLEVWNENKLLFGVILKHTDVDTLDRYFILTEKTLDMKDEAAFIDNLRELEAFLSVCMGGEKLRLDNIF